MLAMEEEYKDEGEEFLQSIASPDALRLAWKYLNKSNPESYGISGQTILEFSRSLDEQIPKISESIFSGKYRFHKNRASLIPKDNGRLRPLQIPEVKDRIVLKSVALQLEKDLNPKLTKSAGVSFAYQKGVGIEDAIAKIKGHLENGYTWIVEADIVNFFGNVNKDRLLNQMIFPNIRNSAIVKKLVERSLNAGLDLSGIREVDKKHFDDIHKGIPQGNPLSPLFSNVYLADFDTFMIESGYKLVRYADDFVVMVRSEAEARQCFDRITSYLKENLGLEVHPLGETSGVKNKSNIVDATKNTFSFLSVTIDKKKIYPSRKNVDNFKSRLDSVCFADVDKKSVVVILQKLKNALDGWISAFVFCDTSRYFKEIDTHINKQLYVSLRNKGWIFSSNVRGKVPMKFRRQYKNPDCLSNEQRKSSGIPFCETLYRERSRLADTFIEP